MPNRIIREDILTSSRVELLDWAEEVFYRRLMSKVDDHGLYDGRLNILRAHLYAPRLDRVREADISRWIAACLKAGLIVFYEVDEKPYVKMLRTGWVARSEPKYPLPPTSANNCAQLQTIARLDVVVDVVDNVVVGKPPSRSRKKAGTSLPDDFTISDRVTSWAAEKGHTRLAEHLDAFKSKCRAKGYLYVDWDEAFMEAVRNDWARLKSQPGQQAQKFSGAHKPFVPDRSRKKVTGEAPVEAKALFESMGLTLKAAPI